MIIVEAPRLIEFLLQTPLGSRVEAGASARPRRLARATPGGCRSRPKRLTEMEKLGDTLVNHCDGIAAYCDHPSASASSSP